MIKDSSLLRAAVWVFLAAVVIATACALTLTVRALTSSDPVAVAINHGEYQAVFLTNGQVYFGKLTGEGSGVYFLRQVYYLRAQKSPQSGKPVRQTLIKLGSELHGPEDLMVINGKQILFVENLKRTGRVTRAILQSGGSP